MPAELPIVVSGKNCWRIERAKKASVIIDAADYYHFVREAMSASAHQVLILGWDFDTRIQLEPSKPDQSETLGEFFLRLARENPQRRIDILKWSFGAKKQFLHPGAAWMLWKWRRTKAIGYCFDSVHPAGCSHHQKIVSIDEQLAVCGGIDIATARWDTSKHLDDEPKRRLPNGKAYPPWHDTTMMLTGPAAQALAELSRDRWYSATTTRLKPIPVSDTDLWPDDLAVQFENVEIAIARTRACYQELSEIREIEALYLDMIAAAKDFIYFENQYFTSAKIAGAIAKRMEEDEPPEIVMVMPRNADGWLEQMAMDAARIRLARAIGKVDKNNRFRIYVPVTAQGEDIYVHAKVSIVDDRLLRIGSSNLNNRSLGLDSECDVIIDAGLEANRHTPPIITGILHRLIAEHLGIETQKFASHFERCGSLVDAIEACRGAGKTLELLDLIKPNPLDTFIADNEILDPESADGFLDPIAARGLRKRWMQGKAWWRQRTRR
ncbi:phospholipase D-like domain-containing protein [Bordetella genomosp. 4]|uniref:Phospholipase n=1 Tax=Bordetella genomosp. 4 TaxID=463044 RepID=A0A261U7C1_9BORD|nr:phospholipase D-like domain-containing protein [Bordetella genomosp. 4]OZI51340.1 phospholipase [Bordetella genomosp. 4]OZI57525.1 phospholipase [Bordetella genomosp. 4]